MKLNALVCALGLGLGAMAPAYAQEYFNCQYSPRCEAIQNKQCGPDRNLKDKFSLIRLHKSAEDVERTWLVLAGLELNTAVVLERGKYYTGVRGLPDEGLSKAVWSACTVPQECAEAFVKATRERWERDDLDAKIKADLERNSQGAMRIGGPRKPALRRRPN